MIRGCESELEKIKQRIFLRGPILLESKRAEDGKLTGTRPEACCVATDHAGNT